MIVEINISTNTTLSSEVSLGRPTDRPQSSMVLGGGADRPECSVAGITGQLYDRFRRDDTGLWGDMARTRGGHQTGRGGSGDDGLHRLDDLSPHSSELERNESISFWIVLRHGGRESERFRRRPMW